MASVSDNASREAGAAVTSPPPKDAEFVRSAPQIELTRSTTGGLRTMTGYASVFNQWTEIRSTYEGHFLERIAPGAFAKTIEGRGDKIKVLFNHGQDPQVGNKPLGPIRSLEEDNYGLRYEVDLLDTAYNRDLLPGLEAGLYGASFRFSVMNEDFVNKPKRSDDNPSGIPQRTVKELRMAEFGPVTFGAYENATAGVRSLTDEFLFGRFITDPERLEALLRSLGKLPEPTKKTFHFTTKDATSSNAAVVVNVSDVPLQADLKIGQRDFVEPEPSEATTQEDEPGIEPEPSAATTPSTNRSLFWFAADPKLKGATK